jgi:hypothetical protein
MNRKLLESYRRILMGKILNEYNDGFNNPPPPPPPSSIDTSDIDEVMPIYRGRDFNYSTADTYDPDADQYWAGGSPLSSPGYSDIPVTLPNGDLRYYPPTQRHDDPVYIPGVGQPGDTAPRDPDGSLQITPPGYQWRRVPGGAGWQLFPEGGKDPVRWRDVHDTPLPIRDINGHYSPEFDDLHNPEAHPYTPPGGFNDPRTFEYERGPNGELTPAGLQHLLNDLLKFMELMYGTGGRRNPDGTISPIRRGPYGTNVRHMTIDNRGRVIISGHKVPRGLRRFIERLNPRLRLPPNFDEFMRPHPGQLNPTQRDITPQYNPGDGRPITPRGPLGPRM